MRKRKLKDTARVIVNLTDVVVSLTRHQRIST